MISLVEEIEGIRKRLNISQSELAGKAGYAPSTIFYWTTGRSPRLATFVDVANTLGYDVVLVRREKNKAA